MQLSRRKLFGFAAAAAASLLVPELVTSSKTIFLPPKGGWVRLPYASLVIPADHAKEFYGAEIASGAATYDINTQMMSWWRSPVAHVAKGEWDNDAPSIALNEFGMPQIRVYRGSLPHLEYRHV